VQLQDLRPVDQALAGEGGHLRLLVAPGGQRGGPLMGAPPLQDLLAGIDHRAVQVAGEHRRQLPGHDRHHRLVQQPQALVDPARPYHGPALEAERERDQVGIGEPPADGDRPPRRPPRARVVTAHHLPQRLRDQQVATLGARLLVLQQSVGPGQPATRLGELALVDQVEAEPERAPRGPPAIAALGVEPLGPLQGRQAVVDPAEEIGGRRQPLQVLPDQRG
jgi:hypothetical protein